MNGDVTICVTFNDTTLPDLHLTYTPRVAVLLDALCDALMEAREVSNARVLKLKQRTTQ